MNLRHTDPLMLIAVLCLAAVTFALASQHLLEMPPCAWCVFQRLIYLVIAFVCVLVKLAGRRTALVARAAAGLCASMAAGGAIAAWYQYTVAANMFSCDLTFADRFMVNSGLDAAVPWLFGIFASCMDARVDLLGIEYALWSLAMFCLIAALSLWAAVQPAASQAHKPQ